MLFSVLDNAAGLWMLFMFLLPTAVDNDGHIGHPTIISISTSIRPKYQIKYH